MDGGAFSAADSGKDQTYFLWVLDQEQLSRTRFRSVRSEAGFAPWRQT